jgi:hypothetical protein
MKKWLLPTLLIIFFWFMCTAPSQMAIGAPYHFTSNYDGAYTFDVKHNNYRSEYRLYISVPSSLYDYYHSKSHSVNGDREYSKFVTPDAVKTIAENMRSNIRNETNSDEEFANNVLAFVHQIPYSVSRSKYPVETIVDNSGDCDVLSFLAASIMKAGNLDVVLFIYRDLPTSHINIGVKLPYTPVYDGSETEATGFEYDNKTYWVAECTPGNWKVGYQSETFAFFTPTIISIENQEESSPAVVSSNLNSPLVPSAISINLSLENLNTSKNWWSFKILGSISPLDSGKKVVMYVSADGYSYKTAQTVTDDFGNYSLAWKVASLGTYYFRTSLIGFSGHASSDSEPIVVFVGSNSPEVDGNTSLYQLDAEPAGGFATDDDMSYNFLSSRITKEFLRENFTGANVSLSGEFIVLKNWQTLPNSQQTITLPKRSIPMIMGRQRMVITIPEQTVTVEKSKPESNNFGFILQNNEGNCSATVKLLQDSDVSYIGKQVNNTTFMNASTTIKENTWYKAVAKISKDEITTELHDENGTILKSTTTKECIVGIGESEILISCEPYTIIAFKNLKAENLDQLPKQPVDNSQPPASILESISTYIVLLVLLATAGAGINFLKKKRQEVHKEARIIFMIF